MEKLNRALKMLNFGASKPRVKGGQLPGSAPAVSLVWTLDGVCNIILEISWPKASYTSF